MSAVQAQSRANRPVCSPPILVPKLRNESCLRLTARSERPQEKYPQIYGNTASIRSCMQSSTRFIKKSLQNHVQTIATPGNVREGEGVPQTGFRNEVHRDLDQEKE